MKVELQLCDFPPTSPARDLGYLLHKHPDRSQTTHVTSGAAHVFYLAADDDSCTAALLLEVDPVRLERLRNRNLGRKLSLALREHALGLESLDRLARGEPLRRVHECVFAVLALEAEPVDPRL